jgi:hypothetical protein
MNYPFPAGFNFTLPDLDDPSVGLLGPQQSTEADSLSDPLTAANWESMASAEGGKRLCTYGTVTYRDIFDQTQYTNFCVSHVLTFIPIDEEASARDRGKVRVSVSSQTAKPHNDTS